MFNLSRLIDFKSQNYLALSSPLGWLDQISGLTGKDEPSRRSECLKAFARIKSFIIMKLNDTSFVGNDIFLKRAIKENLRDIQEELNAKNLFPKLKKEYNQLKATKKAMSKILDPGNEENNYMAVKTWFSSEESVDLENEAREIFESAKKLKKKLPPRKFNRLGQITLFELMLADKSRPGSMEFRYTIKVYLNKGIYLLT